MCSIKHVAMLYTLSLSFWYGYSANILGVFPIPMKSHDILGSALFKYLAKVGHNVTYISAFPHKNFKNFHHIYFKDAMQYKEDNMQSMRANFSRFQVLQQLSHVSGFGKALLECEGVKNLVNSVMKFEVFIHFIGLDASIALAHRFDTPVIIFSPFGGFLCHDKLTGNPAPSSYVPSFMAAYSDEMSFFERIINTMTTYVVFLLFEKASQSVANNHIAAHFPDYPTLKEISERVDLILVNSHTSTESPRPYVPNMIQIGGFHLQEPEPLGHALKKILDDAKDGFVYFSLGTNVNVKGLSPNVLDTFNNVLRKLPMKIIMKYEDDTMPNQPNNFYLRKWFPQASVLAHPNAKLFISHGGYGGSTEALFYGVPMVCMPFVNDQHKNCKDAEHNGYSITISLNKLSEKSFSDALQKVLYDESFKEAVRFKAELYRDQPMNPMKKAVYWIEHVIKHKGAKHLKVKGAELPWYQYYLVDMFLLIGIILYIVFLIMYFTCKFVCRKSRSLKSKLKMN